MKVLFLLIAIILLISCGDETYYSNPEPTPGTPGQSLSVEAKGIISAKCASCHQGKAFLTAYGAFKSKAVPMIRSGQMPPGGGLSDNEKSILLNQ